MIAAHTFKSIIDHIKDNSNNDHTIDRLPIGLMVPGMINDDKTQQNLKLIGILFARPENILVKKIILPNLSYYHTRSKNNCNFYCVGYGAYWNKYDYPDMKPATNLRGIQWYYSDEAFNKLRIDIQQRFNWNYSGQADLILMSLGIDNELDDKNAIVFNLDEMIKDKVITSIDSLFEQIFTFSDKYEGDKALFDFSDSIGISKFQTSLLETLFKLLPNTLTKFFNQVKYFAILKIKK